MRRIKVNTRPEDGELYAQGFTPRGVSKRFAVTRGEWFAREDKNRWTVTHVPTGMTCCGLMEKSRAVDACKRFAALPWLDCDDPMSTATAEEKRQAENINRALSGLSPLGKPPKKTAPRRPAPGTLITLSEEEYCRLSQMEMSGLCLSCGDLDTQPPIEPDAEGYKCPACGAMDRCGLEQALLKGKVDIV